MIKVLKDYYDKNNNLVKPIMFVGGKYLCQVYSTGKTIYLEGHELSLEPHQDKKSINNVIITKNVKPVYITNDNSACETVITNDNQTCETVITKSVESVCEATDKSATEIKNKDNVSEAAYDFYADL